VSSPPELLILIHDPDPPQSPSTSFHYSADPERLVFSAAFDDADLLALTVLACTAGKLADQMPRFCGPRTRAIVEVVVEAARGSAKEDKLEEHNVVNTIANRVESIRFSAFGLACSTTHLRTS
jgi:hypothetical protein